MPHTLLTRRGVARWMLAGVCLLAVMQPVPAEAQSVAKQYAQVTAREKAARASTQSSVVTLRAIARSYESITRAHPTSGYADNALWQAAGVMGLAYERGKNVRDREQAIALLTWLKKEYPTGTLARQVDGRLAALIPASASPVAPAPAAPTAGKVMAQTSTTASTPPAVTAVAAQPMATPTDAPPGPVTARPVTRTTATAAKPAAAVADGEIVARPLPPPPLPNAVRSITLTRLPKGDRLTIELSSEGPYSVNRTGSPDRVFVDLADSGTSNSVADTASRMSGTLLKSLTVRKVANDATRLVLELAGGPKYSTFPLFNPFRLVVDVESDVRTAAVVPSTQTASPTGFMAKTSATPSTGALLDEAPAPVTPASTSRGEFSLARQLGLGVSRIVIDPGHGGHDPGAQANGVNESELVLDVARRLETLLTAEPGFDVVLTRRTDDFIPLEERTALANRASADMFISIHANSSPQPATRGIETYFLDFAANPQAEAVAARENASSAQTMRLLPELVKAITLNNKLDESRELARAVQTSLVRRIAGPNRAVKDLGVKRAPFVVLIGAQMPSVLAEISFLTNRSDAGLLKQATYRQRIAQALFDAVQKYKGSLKQVGTIASN